MIMKNAVDHVYALLLLRDQDPEKYESQIHLGTVTPRHGTSRKRHVAAVREPGLQYCDGARLLDRHALICH